MNYISWFQAHGEKHKTIMNKLTHLSNEEVIEYFRFDNMVEKEPDFCPLYKENRKCHEIPELNCYLCACPNFRFNDRGLRQKNRQTLYSTCSINSKEGAVYISSDAIHQDCSQCSVPHHETYIRKIFNRNWFNIMEKVKEN